VLTVEKIKIKMKMKIKSPLIRIIYN